MQESEQPFLVIRLSSIGDIVHVLPAVAALGRAFPRREIHWAIEKRYAPLLAGNRYVQRVIELDTLGWPRKLASRRTWFEIARALLQLRDYGYDTVIDFQGLVKSAVIASLARSRERVGFAEQWAREPVSAAFCTRLVAPRGRRHVIEWNLALAEHLGAPAGEWEFPLPQNREDDRIVGQGLSALGAREFILISPGGGWKAKRWPPESYSRLIQALGHEYPWTILLVGSPDEERMIQEILGCACLARAHYFPSTLVQFIALARRATLFIAGDTGPLHLAAAVGTPIVGIYSTQDPLNTPERNGPFNPLDITVTNSGPLVQAGFTSVRAGSKNSRYLEGVSVESVLEAVRKRVKRANG